MKKLLSVLLVLTVIFALSACGESEELAAENEALGAELAAALEELNTAEAEIGRLEKELAQAQDEASAAGEKSEGTDELTEQLAEMQLRLGEKYMVYAKPLEFTKAIFRGELAYVDPWTDASPIALGSDIYVELILKASVTDGITGAAEDWCMFRFVPESVGTPFTDIGWAKAEEFEQYTDENMKDIRWPVTLRSGAVIYTDEALTQVLEEELFVQGYSIHITEEGVCRLGASGYGSPLYVKSEDVVYPETK